MLHRLRTALIFACAALCAPAPAGAEARSIISNLANPAIGFNALFRANYAPKLDQPYGMEFEESEVSLISVVDPYWMLSTNLVFAPGGVDPEEVFVTNTSLPGLQFKLGKIRGSFGKHGLLHTHAFPFVEAPVVMGNTIGEEGFKDAGLEAAWLTPLPWYCELTLGSFQPVGPDGDHPLDLGAPIHGNFPALAHLKNLFDVTDETTLEVGASGLSGIGTDDTHHSAYGTNVTVRNVPLRQSNQRGWILQGEFLGRATSGSGARATDADGWYGSFQYRWSQVWWTGVRVEEARHSTTDVLDQAATGPGRVQKASANIAWAASEFSFIRLEYAVSKDDPDGGTGAITDHRAMLQANFTIGFHPPHAY